MQEVFIHFLFIFYCFVGGEEQERSNIASGCHSWNFLWQISFCFFSQCLFFSALPLVRIVPSQ